MSVYEAPNYRKDINLMAVTIFLAGSIEMGKAEMWQDKLIDIIIKEFGDDSVDIFNPRRRDWDSSWVQKASNPEFKQQVKWELTHLLMADIKVFYFDPNTQSPITLLEFGSCAYKPNVIVCCPEGYFRKGNIDVSGKVFGFEVVENFDDFAKAIIKRIDKVRRT